MSNQLNRLVRIMGTFDLATGHADTMDEALDALETELRDLLGHYREALKQNQSEPAALRSIADLESQEPLCPECKAEILYECVACSRNNYPPQRTWVGLTDEEIQECLRGLPTQTIDVYARRIEAKLKAKNAHHN